MFGSFDIADLKLRIGDVEIRFERDGKLFRYVREGDGRVEKNVFSTSGRVIVNPVEPVNLPKRITNFLLVKFSRSFIAEPKSSTEVFLTFPVEIAAFVAAKRSVGLVDVFSLVRPKYTLYGNPRNGIICRFWESDVHFEIPEVEYYREGVMKLRITNSDDDWIEISNLVFDIYGMKIYYDESLVCTTASANITSPKVAETMFIERAIRDGMKKSLELYTARRIGVPRNRYVMEWGL